MKNTEFMTKTSRAFHRVGFKLKKHSPEILIGAGVVGTVASAVMACKATLKVNEVVEEAKTNIEKIHTAAEKGVTEAGLTYTPEDSKKDLTITYVQTGVKLAKLYGPSIALGALSLTAIVKSHNILSKRNIALATAYTTLDKGFKDYRGRVIERFGKDLDRELKHGIKAKEIEKIVVDKDGNETTVKDTVEVSDPNNISPYARFFDEFCAGWTKDSETNLMFLKMQQAYANDKLKLQGHLFLNEVYDMLGIDRTSAGQVVGWVYDEKNPIGDNFVDFGLYDLHDESKRDFVNGRERSILLDFNVDGVVYELLN